MSAYSAVRRCPSLTISALEGLDSTEERVLLNPGDGVLGGDDGCPSHDIELVANGKGKAELESSVAQGLANAGG